MKKVFLVLAVATLGLASCKKTVECECTGSLAALSFKAEDLKGDEVDAAEAACELLNIGGLSGGSCSVK
jgi:hypothetical protein